MIDIAGLAEIKKELKSYSQPQLLEACLRIIKFKKDNKELATYLLFAASNEAEFIKEVNTATSDEMVLAKGRQTNHQRKMLAKVLRLVNKYGRYSGKKETQTELLLHYTEELVDYFDARKTHIEMLLQRNVKRITTLIAGLHPELQYDYQQRLAPLKKMA